MNTQDKKTMESFISRPFAREDKIWFLLVGIGAISLLFCGAWQRWWPSPTHYVVMFGIYYLNAHRIIREYLVESSLALTGRMKLRLLLEVPFALFLLGCGAFSHNLASFTVNALNGVIFGLINGGILYFERMRK